MHHPIRSSSNQPPLSPLSSWILYEDPHLIVLNKPAGLLSQGEHKGDPNVVDLLRDYLGRPYVGLVHRLDRNTSGALVVAKRTKAAQRLTDALQGGEIFRSYLGWVEGRLPAAQRWSHHLLKDHERNVVRVVSHSHPQGKEAVLAARPLAFGTWEGRKLTWVEFVLETGRSHQIRVQSAHEGHPLLGDAKYAGRGTITDFPRPALHSHQIAFDHPVGGKRLELVAPIPEDFRQIEILESIPSGNDPFQSPNG